MTDLLCRLFKHTIIFMVRATLIAIALLLLNSKAHACSCSARGVVPISDMIGDYDFVFMAQVNDAIDYNNNRLSFNFLEVLNDEELHALYRKTTPTKKAKISITEIFKGRLEGSIELNFKSDGSNCARPYLIQGETALFFLQDLGDGFVRAAGTCDASNQYIYSIDQIREFTKNDTNPDLLSRQCGLEIMQAEQWASFLEAVYLDKKPPVDFLTQNCAEYYKDYKAGNFNPYKERKPK